jgi:hypothetical protein
MTAGISITVLSPGGRHEDQILVRSRCRIVLFDDEKAVLMARARSVRGAYPDRLRARIVLAAAGMTNAAIAAHEGVHVDTARKWRRLRFCRLHKPHDREAAASRSTVWPGQLS